IGTTSSTPGAAFSASSAAREPPEPTAATIARSEPRVKCGWNPHSITRSITCCSSASDAPAAMLITIASLLYCCFGLSLLLGLFLHRLHADLSCLENDPAKDARHPFRSKTARILAPHTPTAPPSTTPI